MSENESKNEEEEINHKNKYLRSTSFKVLKRIKNDLMSFAKDEISEMKKSNQSIKVESYQNKEIIAPSKFSLYTGKVFNEKNNQKFTESKIIKIEEKSDSNNNLINKEQIEEKNENKYGGNESSELSDDDDN